MLSSKAKYALRAATRLALVAGTEAWTLTEEIATAEDIPRKFLEAILVDLRDAGIVVSRRGRAGGYQLARHPNRITAGDLIRLIDGPLALTPCSSRTKPGTCADCPGGEGCELRHLLLKARDAVATVLDGCSLADLARRRQDGDLPLDFAV
ncbi:MAG: hypothetical protein RLY86_537 [Pseudomonadota bacterium]|jgi:Rrf2 family protein